ncbi:MAG: hypothetical protein IJW63_05450 [Lachnospiraceae bacterium]|nr:hypothetical protein [Lachnospiraceae bacterium]
MKRKMLYSPGKKIPLFQILYYDEREPCVELKNPRTKKTETIPISIFVAWITQNATVRPEYRVPVGKKTSPKSYTEGDSLERGKKIE